MITISAIIQAKPGAESTMREALLAVATHVAIHEPGTIDFYLSQSIETPQIFTTYERFADRAAMDRHNSSDVVATFFRLAKPLLVGDVILVTAEEYSAKT